MMMFDIVFITQSLSEQTGSRLRLCMLFFKRRLPNPTFANRGDLYWLAKYRCILHMNRIMQTLNRICGYG